MSQFMSLRELYRNKMAEIERQGIQQGIQQERYSLILRLLNRKLGQLSSEIETQVKTLSLNNLEQLTDELLNFNDTSDLVNWLENNGN